eukprot:6146198-Alexandrium_andersonii.AAC.1
MSPGLSSPKVGAPQNQSLPQEAPRVLRCLQRQGWNHGGADALGVRALGYWCVGIGPVSYTHLRAHETSAHL